MTKSKTPAHAARLFLNASEGLVAGTAEATARFEAAKQELAMWADRAAWDRANA